MTKLAQCQSYPLAAIRRPVAMMLAKLAPVAKQSDGLTTNPKTKSYTHVATNLTLDSTLAVEHLYKQDHLTTVQ